MFWVILCGFFIIVDTSIIILLLRNREHRAVRASSPPFMVTLITGIMMIYLSVIMFAFPPSTFLCSFQIWIPNIGFILTLGSLLVKAWKIYKIYGHENLVKMMNFKITNLDLFRILGVLLVIQIALLIIWTAADPFLPKQTPHYSFPDLQRTVCDSSHFYSFASINVVFHVFLLIWGGYLAWRIRKVDKRFNESRVISIAIYQFFLVYAVLIPAFLTLENQPLFRYNISAILLVVSNGIISVVLLLKLVKAVLLNRVEPQDKIKDIKFTNSSPNLTSNTNDTLDTEFSQWNVGLSVSETF
uniref:G-protein coupled receptors family 3 profile domain-containing protein n=1 Tax=Arcella intermedia TaxID=1963864 RepID=A0A6B2L902_9EUKA